MEESMDSLKDSEFSEVMDYISSQYNDDYPLELTFSRYFPTLYYYP
jgi:hypothetical protein